MKVNNFWGGLTDISAKKEVLHGRSGKGRHPRCGYYEAMTRDDELRETVHPAWRVPYIAQVSPSIRDI